MHRIVSNWNSDSFLLRSLLFVPGHVEKYLLNLNQIEADALILDVEDSVPQQLKENARRNIKSIFDSGKLHGRQIIVRINELDSGNLIKDLEAILHRDLLGIMPSKVHSRQDIAFFDELLKQYECEMGLNVGHFKLLPLVETLLAFENIGSIATSSDRLIALAFGGEDFLNELGGAHGIDDHTFDYPRTRIAIAAKAAGLQAIDTPYLEVKDIEGFSLRERKSKDLGFEGCLLIHPNQIKYANDCFSPTEQEIDRAMKINEAILLSERTGLSVALYNGVLIGPPMQRNALKTLNKKKLIDKFYE